MHQREAEMLELQLERQKRLQLERQLEEETARRGELVEQEIRLRERQKVQVRVFWGLFALTALFTKPPALRYPAVP